MNKPGLNSDLLFVVCSNKAFYQVESSTLFRKVAKWLEWLELAKKLEVVRWVSKLRFYLGGESRSNYVHPKIIPSKKLKTHLKTSVGFKLRLPPPKKTAFRIVICKDGATQSSCSTILSLWFLNIRYLTEIPRYVAHIRIESLRPLEKHFFFFAGRLCTKLIAHLMSTLKIIRMPIYNKFY